MRRLGEVSRLPHWAADADRRRETVVRELLGVAKRQSALRVGEEVLLAESLREAWNDGASHGWYSGRKSLKEGK